jgi:N-acetylglutamate synthase-like GNAT family acetyltransferase
MIKKMQQHTDIDGGLPPFLSVINTDFLFAIAPPDGVYFQEIDSVKTLLFSLRGVTATICRLSEKADAQELLSFFELQGIKNVLSNFFFDGICLEERAVLKMVTEYELPSSCIAVSPLSTLSDYENIFNLLSRNGSFETWYPLFSAKINKGFSFGVYFMEYSVPISCAVAPFVYESSGVIAGVFTSEAHRNKGYATRCVKSLLSELQKKNIKEVYLWCEDKNIKFYENIGFSLCGKIYIKKEE